MNINEIKNNNKFKRNSLVKNKTVYKKIEKRTPKLITNSSNKLETTNKNNDVKLIKTIKDFLFNIWKDEKGNNFNFKDFINVLKPIRYIENIKEKDFSGERYFDIIFNE